MTHSTDLQGRAAGLAALAICESLLLALNDLQVIGDREARGVLEDAAAAHRNGDPSAKDPELNQAIVAILDHIIAGRTSIPLP